MCGKCNGLGRYYTVEGIGVKVNPCLCPESEFYRELKDLEFKSFREKIARLKHGKN